MKARPIPFLAVEMGRILLRSLEDARKMGRRHLTRPGLSSVDLSSPSSEYELPDNPLFPQAVRYGEELRRSIIAAIGVLCTVM